MVPFPFAFARLNALQAAVRHSNIDNVSTCVLPALAEFGNSTATVTLSYIFLLRGNGAGGLKWDRGGGVKVSIMLVSIGTMGSAELFDV